MPQHLKVKEKIKDMLSPSKFPHAIITSSESDSPNVKFKNYKFSRIMGFYEFSMSRESNNIVQTSGDFCGSCLKAKVFNNIAWQSTSLLLL